MTMVSHIVETLDCISLWWNYLYGCCIHGIYV